MTDISKCSGDKCPLKETCYRYTAPASPHWQSYIQPPFKQYKTEGKVVTECEQYWNNKDRK
jgi:hypothetical protein